MQFFCTENEFYAYVAKMGLNMSSVIKADIHRAVDEAEATFSLEKHSGMGKKAVRI